MFIFVKETIEYNHSTYHFVDKWYMLLFGRSLLLLLAFRKLHGWAAHILCMYVRLLPIPHKHDRCDP